MHNFDLDSLMSLELPWFEPKNEHRGGWSGVSRLELSLSGKPQSFFIKRQVNFTYRDPRCLFARVPTLRREYRGIRLLNALGIVTPEVVFFAEDKKLRSVLITRALIGYQDLSEFLTVATDPDQRSRVIEALIEVLLRLHKASISHGGLHGKHIMVKTDSTHTAIVLIDLEKVRRSFLAHRRVYKDISQVLRRTDGFTESEKTRLIDAYQKAFPSSESQLRKLIDKKQHRISISSN